MRIAQECIREVYGSRQNARRLHYILWEMGYVWDNGEVYTVRAYHYVDGSVGVQVLDKAGGEELYSEGLRGILQPSRPTRRCPLGSWTGGARRPVTTGRQGYTRSAATSIPFI